MAIFQDKIPWIFILVALQLQYIPRNMHTVFALLCFVVVIHWLIFPYPSGLLHWHCGNLTIAPVPAKQPWWIWINTSCEFIMNDCITTTKQSTTKPCAYFLGYTVLREVPTGDKSNMVHVLSRSGFCPVCLSASNFTSNNMNVTVVLFPKHTIYVYESIGDNPFFMKYWYAIFE